MLKFYDCKVCEAPCIGMPFDGELYDKEVCSPECLAQLEAAEHHVQRTASGRGVRVWLANKIISLGWWLAGNGSR